MGPLEDLLDDIPSMLPFLVTLLMVALALWFADWVLFRRYAEKSEGRVGRQILMLLLTGVGVVSLLLVLPLDPATRTQLLNLLGILLTAVIGLASTTFVSNAMAGLMLRAVRSFRPGDFVRIGEQFGRVTERGLFHTEIQTEDRDLTTLPNLYLVTNPVTVVRASGTIVSCQLSLGYEWPHPRIESLLIEAATAADLQEPFVQIVDLGDFSVTYRVAGFLPKVSKLLTARSNLRKRVLDSLHGADVEIVSPTFMNQRQITDAPAVIAPPEPNAVSSAADPEDLIFDKAERATRIESLKAERDRLEAEATEMEKTLPALEETERAAREREAERLRGRAASITATLERVAAAQDTD